MDGGGEVRGGGELRRVDRRHLVFYLRVHDGLSSKILGHLVDISLWGVMLVCDEPMAVNGEFRLRLHLPRELKETGTVVLDAVCRWCRPDDNPEQYLAGFSVERLLPDTRNALVALIERFGYRA